MATFIFPSKTTFSLARIRVYEHSTREIPLLPSQYSALWRPTSPVQSLQTNLDGPPQKARPPAHPDFRPPPRADLSEAFHASALVQPQAACSFAQFPVPVSPSARALCGPSDAPNTSSRVFDP